MVLLLLLLVCYAVIFNFITNHYVFHASSLHLNEWLAAVVDAAAFHAARLLARLLADCL